MLRLQKDEAGPLPGEQAALTRWSAEELQPRGRPGLRDPGFLVLSTLDQWHAAVPLPRGELLLCSVMKDRRKGEKVEPRRCAKTNHVRRNLFGPVDHSNLQQDIQRILCTSMEKAKQRWNFDFWQEVPTEGLLQWEELQGHDVPPFYHTCVVREVPRPLQPMNRAAAKEPKARHNGKVIEKPSKMAGKKSRPGRKWRQTSLTDYYQAKKQIRTDMQTPVKKAPF
ncbi:cyclin-dependent kinase inhibitor 1-like isoform X4 [Podarcis muralis]